MIPCEGGLAYSLARRVSAQRIFEKRYGMSYRLFIESEHINVPREILEECGAYFRVVRRRYFPLVVPLTAPNLVIGLELALIARLAQGGRFVARRRASSRSSTSRVTTVMRTVARRAVVRSRSPSAT